MKYFPRYSWLLTILLTLPFSGIASEAEGSSAYLLSNSNRSEADMTRDQYRHPAETLTFFQLETNHKVIEIWPGAGWYTRILAPYLKEQGQYIAAHWAQDSGVSFFRNSREAFNKEFLHQPDIYGNVSVIVLEPPHTNQLSEALQADRILTFRNVHNWMRNHQEQVFFNSMFAALKPGGILGVVEHRAAENVTREMMVDSGYVSESYVRQLAENSGFILEARSELNANTADTKDYPAGVWTLPPSLRLKQKDQEKYLAIGESDRMTLRFRKPL